MPTPAEIKDPPKSWTDPETGHRIVRLTNEPGSASFYFNVNAYTPDGTEMIYTTKEGISVLNLKTLATRSVVTGRVRTIVVGHKTPSVFYIKPEENALYVTNVDTGATRKVGVIPPHGNISTGQRRRDPGGPPHLRRGSRTRQAVQRRQARRRAGQPPRPARQQGRDDGPAPRRPHPPGPLHP